jgi:DNA-binding NtrC family response regulator
MPRKPRLLVIDDGLDYARAVAAHLPEFELVDPSPLGSEGRLPDGPAALAFLQDHAKRVDVVLLDVSFDVPEDRLLPLDPPAPPKRTRRFQGVAILREIRKRCPGLPVVLLTALEDLSLADASHDVSAESMTYFLGAGDLDTLRIRCHAALQEASLTLEEADVLWGRAPAMRALRRRLAVLARGALPVILEGETGTGKSYLARRFLHENSGRKGPFLSVDLAAVPADLVPAMLFGAVRGAYTGSVADRKGAFESAHRGTLFLDEVQNIPLDAQKQLLRVLQEGRVQPVGSTRDVPVDVKVVVASNEPLAQAVALGRFRGDLYMRLSPPSRLQIPPLRERLEDLPFFVRRLADAALERAELAELRDLVARAVGLRAGARTVVVMGADLRARPADGVLELGLHQSAWDALRGHAWPGNMRELGMVLENLVTFTLFAAVDAIRSGLALASTRLQVDPGLVQQLLASTAQVPIPTTKSAVAPSADDDLDAMTLHVRPAESLSDLGRDLERQVLQRLFSELGGDFAAMADRLLGDPGRARAVRLRFNQLDLRVRELRG